MATDPTAALRSVLANMKNVSTRASELQTMAEATAAQVQSLLPPEMSITPGMDVQDIINTTPPNVALVFDPGEYGMIKLPPHTWENQRVLRFRDPLHEVNNRLVAEAGVLPHFKSPDNRPAITVLGSRYILSGLETTGRNDGDLVVIGIPNTPDLDKQPMFVMVDRCYVHGDPVLGQKRGIGMHGGNIGVVGCVVTEIKRNGQDSQAVLGNNGPGPYLIGNNLLEATGENILFGGDRTFIANLVPENIDILDNTIRKPLEWSLQRDKWDLKNSVEIKTGRRIRMAGNIVENNWADAQTGYAVLFTPMNQYGGDPARSNPWVEVSDVVCEYNILRGVSSAFNISGYDSNKFVSQRGHDFILRHNLAIVDNKIPGGGDGNFLMVGNGPDGVHVENNTSICFSPRWITTYLGGASVPFRDIPNSSFRANLALHNTYGFWGDIGLQGTAALAKHYPDGVFEQNVLAGGPAKAYPANNLFPTVADFQAAFVDWATRDFRLKPGGPWEGLGCDFSKLPQG